MKFSLVVDSGEGLVNPSPIVYIDDKKVGVVRFRLIYTTKTDEAGDGNYKILMEGYLPGEATTRSYEFDLLANKCREVDDW